MCVHDMKRMTLKDCDFLSNEDHEKIFKDEADENLKERANAGAEKI